MSKRDGSDRLELKRNFTILEFSEVYGLSKTLIYSEIKKGTLRPFKVGKKTLISKEAAEQWQSFYEKKSLK